MLTPLELKMLEVRSWDLAVPQAMLRLQEPIQGGQTRSCDPIAVPRRPQVMLTGLPAAFLCQ